MMDLQIRDARTEDGESVARIYIDSWNQGFGSLMRVRTLAQRNIDRWTERVVGSPPFHWWVATRNESIVGFAGICPSRDPVDPQLGELNTIAVDPEHWRTGVGAALMARVLEQLVADGYPEAILWTLENYPMGQQFYERMGWARDGGTRDNDRQIRYRIDVNKLRET